MKFITFSVSVIIAGLVYPLFADAHHAASAAYDLDTIGTRQGVVEEVFWANPHVHIYIRIASQENGGELWDVETGHLGIVSRRGWDRNTIKVGDEIRVTGSLGRDGSHRILLDEVVRADGGSLP